MATPCGPAPRPRPTPSAPPPKPASRSTHPPQNPNHPHRNRRSCPPTPPICGDHETLLHDFLNENADWEKYRTWDDNTTIANHESLTLRALLDHDAEARDTKWTFAAYESPVSDRMWHMTVAAATPAPILNTLLTVIAASDAWETAVGSPVIEKTVTEATRPLTDAGWTHTVDGRWLRWQTAQDDAGVQFDAFAAQTPRSTLSTWTIWAGPSINHPAWAIHASAYTPASLLAHLAEELAHGTGTRRSSPPQTAQRTSRITATPPPAVPPTAPTAGPRR